MGTKSMLNNYVSDIDNMLQKFDQTHPGLSKSQAIEVEKSRRVSALRDHEDRIDECKNPIDNF